MNLQIHRILTEITGLSGLRILDAILAGERDSIAPARLCRKCVKSSEDTVAKSLEGDYRPEHIFAGRQSLAAYRYYQQLVLETDQEIQRQMAELEAADNALQDAETNQATAVPTGRARTPRIRSSPRTLSTSRRKLDQRAWYQRNDSSNDPVRSGCRCFPIPQCIRIRFLLGLCPEKKISGGKVLFTKAGESEAGSPSPFVWRHDHYITPSIT